MSKSLSAFEDLEFEEDPDPPAKGPQGPVNFDLEENDTASEAPEPKPGLGILNASCLQDEVTPKNDEEERVYTMVW